MSDIYKLARSIAACLPGATGQAITGFDDKTPSDNQAVIMFDNGGQIRLYKSWNNKHTASYYVNRASELSYYDRPDVPECSFTATRKPESIAKDFARKLVTPGEPNIAIVTAKLEAQQAIVSTLQATIDNMVKRYGERISFDKVKPDDHNVRFYVMGGPLASGTIDSKGAIYWERLSTDKAQSITLFDALIKGSK